MSRTNKEMHKLLSKHERTMKGYVDPWGFRGGLFGGVLLAFIFVLSVATDGINMFELALLCLAMFMSGYIVSRLQGLINMYNAMTDIDAKTILTMNKRINRMMEISERQDKSITKQNNMISKQDELITRLRGKR